MSKGSGIHTFTVQEAQNAALGQAQSRYYGPSDGTLDLSSGNTRIIAIHLIESATFDILEPESANYIGTTGQLGTALPTDMTFNKGTTIFGRWTKIATTGGGVVLYIA